MAQQQLRMAALFQELSVLMEREALVTPDLRSQFRNVQQQVLLALATLHKTFPPLPRKAPCLWISRGHDHWNETPLDFIMRIYGPWIRKESEIDSLFVLERTLSVKGLRQCDETVYTHFVRWRAAGGVVPDDFFLPSKAQVTDIRLRLQGFVSGEELSDSKRIARLAGVLRRRAGSPEVL